MPQKGPYGQIILFGDSITQNSFELGFGGTYGPALANGTNTLPRSSAYATETC